MSPIDTAAGLAATVPARGALTRRLLPVALVAFLGFLTVGIPLAVLPTQVQHALGFGTVTVGWVVGIQSIATLLTRQYAGGVCDRRGPRTAVLLGLPLASLAGASYLVSAVAPIGPTASLCVLLAGRLLLGVAESLFLTGTMIWNIGRVGVGNAGRVMAWQGIAIYGALGAGSVIGLALLPRFGFAGVAVAAVAVPLAAMGIALVVPGVAPTGGRRMSFTRVLGRIMAPGLVLALAGLPYGAMAAFLTLDYTSHGWSGAGLALAAFAATFIGIRLVLPGLADRLSGAAVASTSLGVAVVGQTLLWWAPWSVDGAGRCGIDRGRHVAGVPRDGGSGDKTRAAAESRLGDRGIHSIPGHRPRRIGSRNRGGRRNIRLPRGIPGRRCGRHTGGDCSQSE